MNPEIRFRVPQHVLCLAEDRAVELGLDRRKGRTGGVSEFARGALYCALDLALPGDLHQLQQSAFAGIRRRRSALTSDDPRLRVEVHHRVDQEYRKSEAIRRGRPVPARSTTVFEFEVGRLPHLLAPYVLLSEEGYPYVELNLEGPLSPRPKALAEMTSATEEATLEELETTLRGLHKAEKERQKKRRDREERSRKGRQILEAWAGKRGSRLLRARLENGFEWLSLAAEEHAREHLAKVGVKDAVVANLTTSLEGQAASYHDIRPQPEPALETIERLTELRKAEEPGLRFSVILCRDERGQPHEGIRIAIQTPLPDWLYFLTELRPL